MSDHENKINSIIIDKLGVDENKITASAHFIEDLGADSLDTVELIMQFEEDFGIEIPDEDAEKILTVQDAYSYISKNKVTSILINSVDSFVKCSKFVYKVYFPFLPVHGICFFCLFQYGKFHLC